MYHKIEDYALIGDSCAAGLVSKHGSVDWCCIPNFNSPAIFSAILDHEKGGSFTIRPETEFTSFQEYIENTNVVQTHFETTSGKACLTDAFSVREEDRKKSLLFPDHELLRILRCESGHLSLNLHFEPRIFYGKNPARIRVLKNTGFQFSYKEHVFVFQLSLPADRIKINEDNSCIRASFSIAKGEEVLFSLSYSSQDPAIIPELTRTGKSRMKESIRYWKDMMQSFSYSGFAEKKVRRSLLALKLLAHAPSGAIVAAPTTSLPEEIGGDRNWDYRYCWLRDASFTIRALIRLGFEEEARAFLNWILHATQLTRPRIQVVYSLFGHSRLKEKELDWLEGYRSSAPVRIGNEAHDQIQLDVYGEVLDAFYSYSQHEPEFDRNTRRFLIGLGKTICKIWKEPDNGIWEARRTPRHYTHSKVMAWVGLDRIIQLSQNHHWNTAPIETFRQTAEQIREAIEQKGYNQKLDAYTQTFEGNAADASLLTLPLVGYCDPTSSRMKNTLEWIAVRLQRHKLIYRYTTKDGIRGDEGTFGICTFWYIENLAKAGKINKAVEYFEHIWKFASPTGLLSEEMDASKNELLGNYPQGFSHIGLINAAMSIQEAMDKKQMEL